MSVLQLFLFRGLIGGVPTAVESYHGRIIVSIVYGKEYKCVARLVLLLTAPPTGDTCQTRKWQRSRNGLVLTEMTAIGLYRIPTRKRINQRDDEVNRPVRCVHNQTRRMKKLESVKIRILIVMDGRALTFGKRRRRRPYHCGQ